MPIQAIQSPTVLNAARDFARRMATAWPLQSAMLFGSQARGNADAGSDTDVAVLLQGQSGDFVATKLALDDVAYDVLLDSGIRIQPLPIWEGAWAHPQHYSNPRLLENIAREGFTL
jgi:predicted nucleotidyltransferase